MQTAHLMNILAHVGAGSCAMALGFVVLAGDKGTASHRRRGRWFAWFTLAVCASAVAGSVLFRFVPVFAVLTVLVLYQLLSGWHVIYTKDAGPNSLDWVMTFCAGAAMLFLAPAVLEGGQGALIVPSLATLAALLAYDSARWLFPRRWHATLWRYEHSYKLVASLFAMLSAASGNLIRVGQPWSQLLPSALGIAAIAWFWLRIARRARPRTA